MECGNVDTWHWNVKVINQIVTQNATFSYLNLTKIYFDITLSRFQKDIRMKLNLKPMQAGNDIQQQQQQHRQK
jgi:hypothetical protein